MRKRPPRPSGNRYGGGGAVEARSTIAGSSPITRDATATGGSPWPGSAAAARSEDLEARQPLGRLGTAEEMADGALSVASAESSFVTGTELVVDGGVTAR